MVFHLKVFPFSTKAVRKSLLSSSNQTPVEYIDAHAGRLEVSRIRFFLKKYQKTAAIHSDLSRYISGNIDSIFKYLPFVYGLISNKYSLENLIEIYVKRTSSLTGQPENLLRWLELIKTEADFSFLKEKISGWLANRFKKYSHRELSQLMFFCESWATLVEPALAERIMERAHDRNSDYPLLHFLPWQQISVKLREKISNKYLEKTFEELPLSRAVINVTAQNFRAGRCYLLQANYKKTLMKSFWSYSSIYGKVIIIREKGRPLFVLKTTGDRSLLALRSTRRSDNTLATIRGMVYVPSRELAVKRVEEIILERNSLYFDTYDLKSAIRVKPLTWIDRTEQVWWSKRFLKNFFKSLKEIDEKYSQ